MARHMGLSDCCLRTNYWSTHVSQCVLAVQAASGRRLPHHMQRGMHILGKAWGPWRNASQYYDKRMLASTQEPANMTTTLAVPPDVDRSMSDAV